MYVPKTVQVPDELTAPVKVQKPDIVKNADLVDYIVALESALGIANDRLKAIDDLQK